MASASPTRLGLGLVGSRPLFTLAEPVSGRPSFDRTGALWWVSRGRLRHLAGAAPLDPGHALSASATTVPVSGLAGAVLESVAVAHDGVRMVLWVRVGATQLLLLGRITNTSGLRVDGLRPFAAAPLTPTAIAWADPDRVAVLASVDGADPIAYTVGIARGAAEPLGAPAAPLSIAALPGQSVLIGAADGLIYQSVGGTWTAIGLGANPAYPG